MVVVNTAKSAWSPVTSGIPQGSVLGPVLFVLFINDMPEENHNYIQMFAEDTKLYATISNEEDGRALQGDIKKLEVWSHRWQICFSASKCKVMHLGKKNITFTYKMGTNTKWEETLVEKDLGVYIDNDLNFNFHIKKIS